MNLNALMGAVSILSAQILPNWQVNRFTTEIGYHQFVNSNSLTLESLNCVIEDSSFAYSIDFNDGSQVGDVFDNVNNFNLYNIVGACNGKIPTSLEYGISIFVYGADSLSFDVYLNSYSDNSLDVELISESIDELSDYSYSIHFLVDDFDIYYNNYSDLYLTFNYTCFYSDFIPNSVAIGCTFEYVDCYFDDDSISFTYTDMVNFLFSKYYYNLGLENGGTPPDSTMYDLIYDFISNNLLRSEQDTGGLARILTDTSIVLIFITLIMLLVFVFKWCSHNILGG